MRLTDVHIDPRPVAAVRIALGIATVLNALEMRTLLAGIARGGIALPVASSIPTPTTAAVALYGIVAVSAGVALAIGYRAGVAALISTFLNVGVFMWDQQTYSSHRLLAMLLVAYLVFARSDTSWAVSRRRRASTVPWWPQLLMMTQVSVCYFFAAFSKINPAFLDGGALQSWSRLPLPDGLYPILAVATIGTELALAFGLWFPSTRRIVAVLGVILHGAILVTLADQRLPLLSFAVTCLSLYVLFLSRPSAATRPTPVRINVQKRTVLSAPLS